jgi:hydrogenase maturation protease
VLPQSEPFQDQLPVRVVAVGSPHGDDQAGWQLIERLRQEEVPGLEAACVPEPLGLLDHLEGCEALVLVDACRSGAAPGTIVRLDWPDPRLEACGSASTHGFGVARVLALAATLGRLPSRVVILGIEADACRPGAEISPAVTDALESLQRLVLREAGLLERCHE